MATPSMPGNAVPAWEAAGTPVDQCIVGSCTNGSYLETATVADVVTDETVAPGTDAVVAPASKRTIETLTREGETTEPYAAGISVPEATCGDCIGQGHVPAPDSVSLRAFNRNFKARSGQPEDAVYLASPETVAASPLAGEIVDPRDTDLEPPAVTFPDDMARRCGEIVEPDRTVKIERGETLRHVPPGEPLGASVAGPVLTVAGDDLTTDHIVPADAEVMSVWSDPQVCTDYTLTRIDPSFLETTRAAGGGWVVAGENWGQGSAQENEALELAVLDVHGVLAETFARIHFENLVNFGVLPLRFVDIPDRLAEGDALTLVGDAAERLRASAERLSVSVDGDWTFEVAVDLTPDQRRTVVAGGKLGCLEARMPDGPAAARVERSPAESRIARDTPGPHP